MATEKTSVHCYNCATLLEWESGDKIYRLEECPSCSVSVHVCKMCRFYSPEAYNDCKEPNASRIEDKEKANYCDYFCLTDGKSGNQDKNDLFSAAEALFKS